MTTQKKSELLEAKLASLQKDADQFIGHLENELQIAESQRFTDQAQETLRTQIAKARATYDGLLEPVRKDLEAARAEEAEEYKQAMAQIEARAAETKQQIKRDMLTSWIQAGGSLDTFDKIFEEQLYPQEMARRALSQRDDQGAEDAARRRGQNLITDAMSRF
jgi:hypothetical protein